MHVTIGKIRPGEWVAARDNHMVGRIAADHWFGFWAQPLDGGAASRFGSLESAGEFLALEFDLHYGEKVGA